jgi:hypothetical protein
MILFLLAAVVLYLVFPAGLVIGSVAAAIVAAASAAFALLAVGPGVYYGARLTGSPGPIRRRLGFGVVFCASLAATAAGALAVLMTLLAAGSVALLPTFTPFV